MKGSRPQIIAIIPARFGSTRLLGKPLLDLAGRPIIQHVYQRTCQVQLIDEVLVATDDARIAEAVQGFGGNVVMTSAAHETGTDRLSEAAATRDADIIVNVQGDEPFIDPANIEAAIRPLLNDGELMMSTICEPIRQVSELLNPNVVKVVMNGKGEALYFSRAIVPFPRAAALGQTTIDINTLAVKLAQQPLTGYWKHVGLYVYRRELLLAFPRWPRTELEQLESLEQLRVLEHGYRIAVVKVEASSLGIDTPEDLARARQLLAEGCRE